MNKVESFEQYKSLIGEFKAECKKTTTNCYFLREDVQRYIEAGSLYYERHERTFLLTVRECTYDHIYYYQDAAAEVEFHKQDRQAVLDFVVRRNKVLDIASEEEKWKKAGFEPYKEYVRMCMKLDGEYTLGRADEEMAEGQRGKLFSYGDEKYAEQILKLWQANLDALSTPLPKLDTIRQMIRTGHVYYILDGTQVIGALYLDVLGKSCLLQHLVIDGSCRKQRLGFCLLNYAFVRISQEKVAMCNLWVDVQNVPACELYQKYGFEKDGLISKQYLYK
ncbi:MAG: GNAT family N-acetyltransferase [Roseburia sp.]|nr:GNAT family N-acetyltransferase [Roseburia sp.]MCM1277491.1 GNAT family N-acetyltransferase [Robinsoniella sp.]